jgi:hypothetical protein
MDSLCVLRVNGLALNTAFDAACFSWVVVELRVDTLHHESS